MKTYTVNQFYDAIKCLIGLTEYEQLQRSINFNVPRWCETIAYRLLTGDLNDDPQSLQVIKDTATRLWKESGTHELIM